MSFAIALTDERWSPTCLIRPGRRGAPPQIRRRQMVDAMLFIARTGCQWRYLPERYGSWTAVSATSSSMSRVQSDSSFPTA